MSDISENQPGTWHQNSRQMPDIQNHCKINLIFDRLPCRYMATHLRELTASQQRFLCFVLISVHFSRSNQPFCSSSAAVRNKTVDSLNGFCINCVEYADYSTTLSICMLFNGFTTTTSCPATTFSGLRVHFSAQIRLFHCRSL